MILIISLPDDNAPYQSRGSGERGAGARLIYCCWPSRIQTILNYITTHHSDITAALEITLQWIMISDQNRKVLYRYHCNGGHKKFNGTFCQNTDAVFNKQAHIKHSSIEIDDTESDKICLSAPSPRHTKTVLLTGLFISQRFVSIGSRPRPYLSSHSLLRVFPSLAQCQ